MTGQEEDMNYIVLDLEWNQSPGGKEDSVEHLPFEIIEIGAVKLNEAFQQTGEFHRLIRPQVYHQMHFKILEVTHMNMGELKHQGRTFPRVIREFLSWCGKDFCFCTWGSMDLTELQRNMAYYHIEIPFSVPLFYYDVQKLYCLEHGDGKNKPSLDQAVQEQGIPMERPFHRALDDAYYTGRVLSVLDFTQVRPYVSVDYYRLPAVREAEVSLRFPSYLKYVSRTFETREEALKDKTVNDMMCPCCNRMLRKKVRWFPYGQRFCFGLANCPEHGMVRGKLRIKKAEYGETYVVKTMKMATDEEIQLILQKKEEGRRKRNSKNHLKKQRQRQHE